MDPIGGGGSSLGEDETIALVGASAVELGDEEVNGWSAVAPGEKEVGRETETELDGGSVEVAAGVPSDETDVSTAGGAAPGDELSTLTVGELVHATNVSTPLSAQTTLALVPIDSP